MKFLSYLLTYSLTSSTKTTKRSDMIAPHQRPLQR